MRRKRRAGCIGAILLAASLGLAACAGGTDLHHGRGVVLDVDLEGRHVTIEHGDIPGLMQAMTMTFGVAESVPLDGIRPGTRVDFDVRADGRVHTVVRLEPR